MRSTGFAVTCLLLFTVAARGQNVSEQYCKQVERSIVEKLRPMKVNRQEVYSNECVFEFTVAGDSDVSLTIQKHNTEKASHESLDGFLELIALGDGLERKDLRFEKLDSSNSWDETYFFRATTTNSALLALRKGKFAITILSRKDELVIEVEKLLRTRPELKNR
jgi:hypothetical protein